MVIGLVVLAMLIWSFNWVKLLEIAQPNKISIANPVLAYAGAVETERKVSPTSGDEGQVAPASQEASPESIENLIRETFPEAQNKALAVFKCESGLNPSKHSDVDLMSDGRAFSVGLTQINLTVTKIADVNCPDAFQGRNKYAKVINEELYQKCVKLAENPEISLETAKIKYNGGNWSPWMWCSQNS